MKKKIKLKSLISCIAIIFREKPFLASLEGLSYLGSAITTGFMPLVWAFVFQAIENYITGKNEYKRQLQTVHITEKQFTEENGFDRSQIRSVRFAFDRIENGAVNMDNIAFVK